MVRRRPRPAPGGWSTSAARQRPGRSLALLVALVPSLGLALAACGVETVEGEIADQQVCVAAQPLVEAVGARGSGPAGSSATLPDPGELAARAADAELRSALTDLAERYAEASGDGPEAAVWAEADRAVATLERVCQRLSAF